MGQTRKHTDLDLFGTHHAEIAYFRRSGPRLEDYLKTDVREIGNKDVNTMKWVRIGSISEVL
jgi:hypothetical protein